MLIYKAQNKINGKIYIGKTIVSLEMRIGQHRRSANRNSSTAFHCAIKKYGIDKFIFECLDSCDDKDKLNELEKYYILSLNSKAPIGYNLTDGGDGNSIGNPSPMKGRKHSEETKLLIREKRKLQICSDETRKKMSESRKGKPGPTKGMKVIGCGFKKGNIPYNKGRSSGMKGKEAWNKGLNGINTGPKEGYVPWNKGLKGIHCSPESEFKKGMIPWNKGVKGIHPKSEFKKGNIPWNKGIKTSDITGK